MEDNDTVSRPIGVTDGLKVTAINYPVTVDAKKLCGLILTGDAIVRDGAARGSAPMTTGCNPNVAALPLVGSIPLFGHVVICHRRWIPGHVNSDGKPCMETVLAKRMSREPWTVLEDTSRNAWWHGVNEADGREWSDSIVESWQPITWPNIRITNVGPLEQRWTDIRAIIYSQMWSRKIPMKNGLATEPLMPESPSLNWHKADPRKSDQKWYVVRWQGNGSISVQRGDRIAWEGVAYWLEIPEPPDFQWDCRAKSS